MLGRLHLWVAAIWCGGAVMVFELAGARLLMPMFGSGIDVWAVAVGVTLAALAIGYWTGGRVADKPSASVWLTAVLLACAVTFLVVRMSGWQVPRLFSAIPPVHSLLSAALCIFVPSLVLLGMCQPILMGLLLRGEEKPGQVAGRLLVFGTAGGVSGSLLTGLWLMPRVGVSMTMLLLGVGTALVGCLCLVAERRGRTAVATILLAVPAIYGAHRSASHVIRPGVVQLEHVESAYGDLEVFETSGTRWLLCNGVTQAAMPVQGMGLEPGTLVRGGDYTDLIAYYRPQARTALLVGLGGALHPNVLARYGIGTRCVEIDPAVAMLAAKHFALTSEVVLADGRAFLERDTACYDAVIVDAFLGASPPVHLYTKEACELVARHLTEDGVLVVHAIGRPGHPAARALAATLATVFPHMACAGGRPEALTQHLYFFASRSPLELKGQFELAGYGFSGHEFHMIDPSGGIVLTDDETGLAVLNRDVERTVRLAQTPEGSFIQ